MSKLMYISYSETEGIMAGLGFTVMTIHKGESLVPVLRQFLKQNVSVVYVSEEVYENHQAVISSYDKEFGMSINILADSLMSRNLAEKRFDRLLEEAIGIKIGNEEES